MGSIRPSLSVSDLGLRSQSNLESLALAYAAIGMYFGAGMDAAP